MANRELLGAGGRAAYYKSLDSSKKVEKWIKWDFETLEFEVDWAVDEHEDFSTCGKNAMERLKNFVGLLARQTEGGREFCDRHTVPTDIQV